MFLLVDSAFDFRPIYEIFRPYQNQIRSGESTSSLYFASHVLQHDLRYVGAKDIFGSSRCLGYAHVRCFLSCSEPSSSPRSHLHRPPYAKYLLHHLLANLWVLQEQLGQPKYTKTSIFLSIVSLENYKQPNIVNKDFKEGDKLLINVNLNRCT